MIPPVIQYHKIDSPSAGSLVRGGFTPPRRFARQMKYLKEQGVTFYTIAELIEYFREHQKFPVNSIAITFDDGFRDNYTNAFQVLKRLGIKATLFIVPSCIGQSSAKALAHGEAPRPHLSREQILEMSQHGIEIGSHTMNHRLLHEISDDEIKFEVEEAKHQIENLVQQPCKSFAYPAGFFTATAQRIIEEAGHTAAFSTTYGPSNRFDLYALNRLEILRRDRFLFQFAAKLKRLNLGANGEQ
jgi:peptidoglycan/xylan/chitin deacetylase (PgdA/CDA1 family)